MSRTVTIDLSDEEFALLEMEAAASGQTPSELILQRLRGDANGTGERAPDPPMLQRPHGDRDDSGDTGPSSGTITKADVEAALLIAARRAAARTGQTPEEALAEWRVQLHRVLFPEITDEDKQRGLDSLRPFFGAFDSGDPNNSDNERIDADLAREYGRCLKWEQ